MNGARRSCSIATSRTATTARSARAPQPVFDVEEPCRRARAAGVLSVVDGAHARGHVPLGLERLGADFYAGDCHNWLCAPKSAGFLYARPERQALVEPLAVGWGCREGGFSLHHDWGSTRDPAAYLAIPVPIAFVREHARAPECRAPLLRVSIAPYNTRADVDRLEAALVAMF